MLYLLMQASFSANIRHFIPLEVQYREALLEAVIEIYEEFKFIYYYPVALW